MTQTALVLYVNIQEAAPLQEQLLEALIVRGARLLPHIQNALRRRLVEAALLEILHELLLQGRTVFMLNTCS